MKQVRSKFLMSLLNLTYSKAIFVSLIALIPTLSSATTPPQKSLVQISIESVAHEALNDNSFWNERDKLLRGIVHTLNYLKSPEAASSYSRYQNSGVEIEQVEGSLRQFYQLMITSSSYHEFQQRLVKEFSLYQSVGNDGHGTIRFTGYFQPVYKASLEKTAEYKYPIFRKPRDFEEWTLPHPTRVQLEGYRGQTDGSAILKGQELAYLKSRYEAFMVHVQGSAILELPHGERLAVGYAAGTKHPFRGVSADFLKRYGVSWNKLDSFFSTREDLLNQILAKNNRFIFFERKPLPDALGSLGVPVIPERSIATDSVRLPPGAIGIITTRLPVKTSEGTRLQNHSKIVLNLDTGSAIQGPGRVDVFMGTGEEAYQKASSVYGNGKLYYLFVKNSSAGYSA